MNEKMPSIHDGHFIRAGTDGKSEWFMDEYGRYKIELGRDFEWTGDKFFEFTDLMGRRMVGESGVKRVTDEGKVVKLDGFYIKPKEEA